MKTDTEILDDLIARERGWRDAVSRPDGTVDPMTNHGVTLPTLQAHADLLRGMRVPQDHPTWEAALRALTEEQAAIIYTQVYVRTPGFTAANIPFEPLLVQLIDFGVNSGSERAVRWLQRVMHLPVTGTLNAQTVNLLRELSRTSPSWSLAPIEIVNDALVAARIYMIRRAVASGTIRKEDSEGLQSRALSFFLAVPTPEVAHADIKRA